MRFAPACDMNTHASSSSEDEPPTETPVVDELVEEGEPVPYEHKQIKQDWLREAGGKREDASVAHILAGVAGWANVRKRWAEADQTARARFEPDA